MSSKRYRTAAPILEALINTWPFIFDAFQNDCCEDESKNQSEEKKLIPTFPLEKFWPMIKRYPYGLFVSPDKFFKKISWISYFFLFSLVAAIINASPFWMSAETPASTRLIKVINWPSLAASISSIPSLWISAGTTAEKKNSDRANMICV